MDFFFLGSRADCGVHGQSKHAHLRLTRIPGSPSSHFSHLLHRCLSSLWRLNLYLELCCAPDMVSQTLQTLLGQRTTQTLDYLRTGGLEIPSNPPEQFANSWWFCWGQIGYFSKLNLMGTSVNSAASSILACSILACSANGHKTTVDRTSVRVPAGPITDRGGFFWAI